MMAFLEYTLMDKNSLLTTITTHFFYKRKGKNFIYFEN